ncbi:hypothetical protein [Blastococcus deserti]|uniref:Uncharacterized protein n=1 Tax=Blastococcus deserti TaxID=2259033 RepID=A0ABW4XDD6_9ACTN
MGEHSRPRRRGRSVPFLSACCSVLTVAAVVAAVQPTPGEPRRQPDVPATLSDDWVWSAVDESPPTGGPLEIPTIGVVVDDYEARYDALAAARAADAASSDPVPLSAGPPAEEPDQPAAEKLDASSADPSERSGPSGPSEPSEPVPPADAGPTSADPTAPPADPPGAAPEAPRTPADGRARDDGPRPTVAATPSSAPPPAASQAPPPEKPPAEKPPAEKPPAEEPAAEPPPTQQAPTEPPPAEPPPTDPPPTDPPPAEQPPTAEPPPATDPPQDRYLVLGETYEKRDAAGRVVFSIALDRVAADPSCSGTAVPPPGHGHLVALHVRVLVAPAPAAGGATPAVTAGDFRYLGADGSSVPDVATPAAAACLTEAERWPNGGPGPETPATGTVVLDVPATTGTIVYRPAAWPTGLRWRF